MRFDIITIFPEIFDSYFNESILGRAQKKKLIKIKAHDLRKFTTDRHKTVDDKPYGGGAGMLLKVEPIYKCVSAIKSQISKSKSQINSKLQKSKKIKQKIILFSAKGKTMTQADARRWSKYDQLILICGRYEGVDERVAKHIADEEVSVGNYVLTGGEIPAMIVTDAVARLVPGVIKQESLHEESFNMPRKSAFAKASADAPFSSSAFSGKKMGEYPQYTRPEEFMGWKVPEVLLSGNHSEIKKWREKMSKKPH
jgi:tRNA (guanine37-N1)-methyltransferase